jgi:hypothetical protein
MNGREELNAATDERIAQIKEEAEIEYWDTFKEEADDIPSMAFGRTVMQVQLGGSVAQAARTRMQNAIETVDRLRSETDRIRALTDPDVVRRQGWSRKHEPPGGPTERPDPPDARP